MDKTEFLHAFLAQRQMLFGFVYSLLPDRDRAEDVFQDVAAIALEKCGVFEAGTNMGAWLREIARRRVMKAFGAADRRAVTLEPAAIDAIQQAHDRSEDGIWHERADALRTCLEKLPDRARAIVEMRYREFLGFSAIAERLASTVNSIRVTLSKIRKGLRQCVDSSMGRT